MKKLFHCALIGTFLTSPGMAATWEYSWKPTAGEAAPKFEIAPLKYGKKWAYAVEIDDNPASTLTVSQPLLAQYSWNDAPPGVAGGNNKPFVGTAALMLITHDTANPTRLNAAQVRELQEKGWVIANHSYWHSGVHWDKSKANKPEDFKRELFWSQALFAELIGNSRAPTHFVLPNGDYNYAPYLSAYGLRSASRISASSPLNLNSPKLNLLDYGRNYLDEGYWAKQNHALYGLPAKPQPGDFIIDFTHGMDKDPESVNYKRWVQRLDYIAKNWGAAGDNSMWVAPTEEVVNYHLAAQAAKVTTAPGKITITLPDDVPGSTLTLKISGLSDKTQLKALDGGVLHRQGDTVWLTTPTIGVLGTPPPTPRLKKVYSGEVKNVAFDKPVAIAGVRFLQSGPVANDFLLQLEAVTPEGKTESLVSEGKAKIAPGWGAWPLFPTIPDREAVFAEELHVNNDKNLKQMEVWAVAE